MREKGVEKREMKNRDRFTGRIFRRMWGPAIISSAGWALSDIADAVVVGQRMGAVGLAAIALILPVYMINCMFAHGLGLGGSVRLSLIHISKGEWPEERKEKLEYCPMNMKDLDWSGTEPTVSGVSSWSG